VKASVFVGTSVDGFIARTNGQLDFLPKGGGEAHGYDEFMATVDALVIGRNTYEAVLAFAKWPYREKPVFVLSSLLMEATGAWYDRLHVTERPDPHANNAPSEDSPEGPCPPRAFTSSRAAPDSNMGARCPNACVCTRSAQTSAHHRQPPVRAGRPGIRRRNFGVGL
jgi:hypothetical protein